MISLKKLKTIFFLTILIGLPYFSYSTTKSEKTKALNTAASVNYLSPLEKEVIYEINLFRSNPAEYAKKYIAPLAQAYDKKILHYPGETPIMTIEGNKALKECMQVLKNKQQALPILYPNELLTKSATDHQQDQSKTGKTGHVGSDKSKTRDRIERYGKWETRYAENIAYGSSNARQIVIFLLIDDGVKGRGHRTNFLRPDINIIGVACGSHPAYRSICVMDFAGGISTKE